MKSKFLKIILFIFLAEEPPKVQDDEVQHQDVENTEEKEPKGQSNAKKRVGDDTGHEADMDDTSMSSRASSRMLESINVMSMDSMNVMYDSEYDDLRLASASAGTMMVILRKKFKNIIQGPRIVPQFDQRDSYTKLLCRS